ncbi:MAG: hypothetical protein AAB815_02060 [Patescibacteria group bacterium]
MTTITVSELRSNLPLILHKVLLLKETFVITKHGQPFSQLGPVPEKMAREMLREK